jgi:predicted amidohydrolase
MPAPFLAAAVQATPVYLDKKATTEKACRLIREAGSQGAKLVVFPELFIAMYPLWVPDVFNSDPQEAERYIGRSWYEHWSDYIDEAVEVPGPETAQLGEAAREAEATVVIGVNERDPVFGSGGKLYNTAVVIGPDGALVGRRRKLTPVVHELLYHARGDGSDVRVFDTTIGTLGIGQCFEHLYPPYRYALGARGEQVHCALWYAVSAISHLVDASARQHAMEMGTWVVVSVSYDPEDPAPGPYGDRPAWRSAGGSGIISPWGQYVAGPVYGEETIVCGEVDLNAIRGIKAAFDSTGKDARPDLFDLRVASQARPVVAFEPAPQRDSSAPATSPDATG